MKLSSIFTSLCICLCMILAPGIGHGFQLPLSHDDEHDISSIEAFKSSLSRKLRVLLDETRPPVAVKHHGDEVVSTTNSKQKGDLPGKAYNKEENGRTRSGTMQEWVEGKPETWQFFTMDYSHVRRRRPIHNKALPVGP